MRLRSLVSCRPSLRASSLGGNSSRQALSLLFRYCGGSLPYLDSVCMTFTAQLKIGCIRRAWLEPKVLSGKFLRLSCHVYFITSWLLEDSEPLNCNSVRIQFFPLSLVSACILPPMMLEINVGAWEGTARGKFITSIGLSIIGNRH